MSSIGSITKGVAENFSDLIAEIEKSNAYNKSLITFSLSHISNTMNHIRGLTSSRTICDRSGMMKAGNLQHRLTSQEG
jgi:hypothetical protein